MLGRVEDDAVTEERAAEGPDRLPTLVRRFVERNLPDGPLPTVTRVSQRGRMWKRPGSKPMQFTGVAQYGVRHVTFSWRAKFPIAGQLAWLSIVDAYDKTGGRMDGRVWGLVPFMRTRGDEVEVGEVSRFVAELPWTPYSIVGNKDLEWRETGERSVRVATSVGPRSVELTFGFDGEGDIASCIIAARPRKVGRTSIPTPWRGEFSDYALFEGGVRIPRYGKVQWDLPEGPFVYWQGEMTGFSTA
jgi:hypothetical protein